MRNTFADTFYDAATKDDRLCVVVADISPAGSIAKFRNDFPDRFINTGIAEQIMIGICAGMAMRGLRPFAYTIATFALFRPYEIIRDDLCYQNIPVTVVGIGGGVNYSTLGSTHQAIEDITIASSLPNMQVIAPCDPLEVRDATLWAAQHNQGPVYMRLARAGEPNLTEDAEEPWEFGKLRLLRKGRDVCIISYGAVMKNAMEVADILSAKGKSVSVVSAHTLKPLDEAGIKRIFESHDSVISIEEMVPNGSLGTTLKRLAWENGASVEIQSFTLKDAFLHSYGSYESVLAAHGLAPETIVDALTVAP